MLFLSEIIQIEEVVSYILESHTFSMEESDNDLIRLVSFLHSGLEYPNDDLRETITNVRTNLLFDMLDFYDITFELHGTRDKYVVYWIY
jgi:hypothetical protein